MERILLPLPPVPSDSNDNLIENCIIGRFSFHRLVFLSIHCVPSSNCLSCTKYPSTSSSGCMQWKTHKRFRTHDSAIGLVWLTFPTNTHTHTQTQTHIHTQTCWSSTAATFDSESDFYESLPVANRAVYVWLLQGSRWVKERERVLWWLLKFNVLNYAIWSFETIDSNG